MRTLIYGNGAMAKVLFSYVRAKWDVTGFTVDRACIAEQADTFCGLPLVPFETVEDVFDPQAHKIIVAVGFLEMNALRERKHNEAEAKGYAFDSYVHETVVKHMDVSIEDDCIVLDHVSIHPGCTIGRGTFISANVSIGHDCIIGPYCYITSGVSMAGGCHIGEGCFFGVNSSVVHSVRVGERNLVGANTLLSQDSEDDEVYVSAPGERHRLSSTSFLKFSLGFNR